MASPLPAFVCFVYTLSAGLSFIVWSTGGHQSPFAFPFGVGAMFVPALATLVVVSTTDAAGPTLRWNSLPVSYLSIALLLIPLVMHAAMLPVAAAVWGGLPWASWLTPDAAGLYHTPADRNWGVLTAPALAGRLAMNMLVGVLVNSALAFFEEVGWRAWMLPRLSERMSSRRAVVATSVIWAFWHTPFALSGIHYLPGIPTLLLVVTLPVVTVGAGLVIGWLWLRTESIWIVALAHGALNNWGQYAFRFMDAGGPGGQPRDMLILASGGLALLAVGSLLLLSRRTRRNHLSVSHEVLRGTVVDDPPDAPTHHRGISANTPQPRYSRV